MIYQYGAKDAPGMYYALSDKCKSQFDKVLQEEQQQETVNMMEFEKLKGELQDLETKLKNYRPDRRMQIWAFIIAALSLLASAIALLK